MAILWFYLFHQSLCKDHSFKWTYFGLWNVKEAVHPWSQMLSVNDGEGYCYYPDTCECPGSIWMATGGRQITGKHKTLGFIQQESSYVLSPALPQDLGLEIKIKSAMWFHPFLALWGLDPISLLSKLTFAVQTLAISPLISQYITHSSIFLRVSWSSGIAMQYQYHWNKTFCFSEMGAGNSGDCRRNQKLPNQTHRTTK